MEQAGAPSHDPDEPVGAVLARMRKAKGLTGADLGQLTGMSQSKISRIENAKGLAEPQDIERLARALGADESVATQLVSRAEIAHNRMTDWRPSPIGLAGTQQAVGRRESEAATLRCFEPTAVHGLLQTSEYARAILTAFQKHGVPDLVDNPGSAILEAVAARVRRQEILSDSHKSFRFVMLESVLSNQFCAPDDMVGQIRRLRQVHAEQKNVSLRIIPEGAAFPLPPMHGFTLFDDRLVMVDVFNTGLTTQGGMDARLYRNVFDSFEEVSVTDIDPILDKYYRRYARMLLAN